MNDDNLYKGWWYMILYGASPQKRMQIMDEKRKVLSNEEILEILEEVMQDVNLYASFPDSTWKKLNNLIGYFYDRT